MFRTLPDGLDAEIQAIYQEAHADWVARHRRGEDAETFSATKCKGIDVHIQLRPSAFVTVMLTFYGKFPWQSETAITRVAYKGYGKWSRVTH